MSDYAIKLPVRGDEPVNLKAVSELPGLLDDPEDVDVCRELLLMVERAAYPKQATIGQVDELIENMEPLERKTLLDACRVNAGLETMDREQAAERLAYARKHADYRSHEPVMLASGAIGSQSEIDDETARWQTWQRSRDAQRQSELEQRAVEAEAMRASDEARDAQLESELPRSFRNLPPSA